MKLTKFQKSVIAQYASNGWNDGITGAASDDRVFADAAGIESQALAAYRDAYARGGAEAAKFAATEVNRAHCTASCSANHYD